MEEQRVDIGVKNSFEKKLARSRLEWAWEDCVNWDKERVGEKSRLRAKDRSWRLLIDDVVSERCGKIRGRTR